MAKNEVLVKGTMVFEEGTLRTEWTDNLDMLEVMIPQGQDISELHQSAGIMLVQQVFLEIIKGSRSRTRDVELASRHRARTML